MKASKFTDAQKTFILKQLQRGDVVLFRFPLAEEGDELGAPKRCPCLVLDTLSSGDDRFVEIAYSTSADARANRGYKVIVKQSAARKTAGLAKPTPFVCARRLIAHAGHSSFHSRTKGPHILGRLDEDLMEWMNAVRTRIQAKADIAAYDREEQRWDAQAREDRGKTLQRHDARVREVEKEHANMLRAV